MTVLRKKTLLITCGCSWTFGVGAGYTIGMSKDDYLKIAVDNDICGKESFRGILANEYGLDTFNLAHGQSSNQRQLRLIKKFFISAKGLQARNDYDSIIVLHGITSTARNEMYINELKQLTNFKYDNPEFIKWSTPIIEHFYDHDNEVALLADEMNFMNLFYNAAGIKNIWFDTFNHHNYPIKINNLLEPGHMYRDLMSSMASSLGFTDFEQDYHKSSWVTDSNRIQFLLDKNLVNPISLHPTKQGHIEIAKIISKQLNQILGK
jgi:hypothetical protein